MIRVVFAAAFVASMAISSRTTFALQQGVSAEESAAAAAAVKYVVRQELAKRHAIVVSGLTVADVNTLGTTDNRITPFAWTTECGPTVASNPRVKASCGLRNADTHIEVLRIGKSEGSTRKVLVVAYMPTEGLIRSDDGMRFIELDIEVSQDQGRWSFSRVVGGRIP